MSRVAFERNQSANEADVTTVEAKVIGGKVPPASVGRGDAVNGLAAPTAWQGMLII